MRILNVRACMDVNVTRYLSRLAEQGGLFLHHRNLSGSPVREDAASRLWGCLSK